MKELSCEDMLIAQMAMADGEEPGVSKEQLTAHIAGCVNCQSELTQSKALDQVLAGHTLAESRVDLWPAIDNRIPKRTRVVAGWQPFAVIGALLVAYKLVELLPAQDLGLGLKLIPLIIIPVLFFLIKENPFRINPELVQER
ncbi:MAG TPA: hypothetical protein VJT15_23080 [Pyrinomonadaceae bacterium]|nr:hypothetical protein [Pyrinomonadaceae bacterium]